MTPRRNPKLSPAELRVLADAYRHGADIAGTREVRAMAEAQAERVNREFARLQRRLRVEFTDIDPYATMQALRDDVRRGKMRVWTGASDTPLWDPETNWKARAVHDYDHATRGVDFSPEGEIEAYRIASARAPALEPLYASEIVLQAADAALRGFEPGRQRVVPVGAAARQVLARRNAGEDTPLSASEARAASVVYHVAGLEGLMTHLAELGYPLRDAMTLAVAARMEVA